MPAFINSVGVQTLTEWS